MHFKTCSFTFFIFIQILVGILTGAITPSLGAVNYPVISTGLRSQIVQARQAGIFVGGEWTELWQGERLAIAVPNSPNHGYLLEVQFLDVPGLPGYRQPVLSTAVLSIHPAQEIGYFQFDDGTREYYGSNSNLNGVKSFIYAWSWYDEFGLERWSVTVTHGDGADIYDPGKEIDRAQFGTIPGEPIEVGVNIIDSSFRAGDQTFGILYDDLAEFRLETSTDTRLWSTVPSTITEIPDAAYWQDGVQFRGALLRPDASLPGARRFFRITKNP